MPRPTALQRTREQRDDLLILLHNSAAEARRVDALKAAHIAQQIAGYAQAVEALTRTVIALEATEDHQLNKVRSP